MSKLHLKLTQKSKPYANWHQFKYHPHLHWLAFGLTCLITSLVLFFQIQISFVPLELSQIKPVQAQGNSYYVSPQGNDAHNGSIDSPWRHIWYAVKRTKAGDTVLLRGGVYEGEEVYIRRDHGQGGAPWEVLDTGSLSWGRTCIYK